jgi:type VI secretion system secreted protein Hcp
MPKRASFTAALAASILLLLPVMPGLGQAEAQMTMSLASAGRGSGVNAIIEGYHHSIEVPQDELTARATGRRQHKPLTVTKWVDKATPLLYRAMSGSETIPSVTIRVPTSEGRGGQPVILTLTNARIVGIESSAAEGTTRAREDVSFIYEKIKWASAEGGTEFEDSWRENR